MFTRHKFLLVTVKEWLKSALDYRSYPQVNLGIRFWTTLYLLCKCLLDMLQTKTSISYKHTKTQKFHQHGCKEDTVSNAVILLHVVAKS